MRQEHRFTEFLKVKNIPLTDISGIELEITSCLCGCGNYIKTAKHSAEKYFSKYCPRSVKRKPSHSWATTMCSGEFKKKKISNTPEGIEKKAAELYANGASFETIAERLEVKLHTARNYVNKFKRKLGVKTYHAMGLYLKGAA